MDKLLEILKNHIGFSWKGLIIFLLPMLPNLLFFIYKDPNGVPSVANKHIILDIIEHSSQALFIVLLIFFVNKKTTPLFCGYTFLMTILLISYCGLWVTYFTIGANYLMLILMAILPVIYFILAEIWLHNFIAIIPTVVFGIVHIIITYINYYPTK